ncbi:hypothetical protein [Gymnodinialimonas sp.]
MAAVTTNISRAAHSPRPSLMARFDAFFKAVATARTCAQEIEHLSDLSDAQLAARGLTRQTLVRHAARAYL